MKNMGGGRGENALLSRFSRRTAGGRWIPEIDGIRFLAIGFVVANHVAVAVSLTAQQSLVAAPFGTATGKASATERPGLLSTFFRQGSVGVQVFFMVSGFVLALPFVRERVSSGSAVDIRRYFRRRLTRIEPPYLIVMVALFLGSLLASSSVGSGHLFASLGYLHDTYYRASSPLNGVSWSLEIEVQFYVLAPALALLLCAGGRPLRRAKILLLALLLTVSQVLGYTVSHAFLTSFLQFFLMGWLLADVYVVDWEEAPTHGRGWDVVGFVALLSLPIALAYSPQPVGSAIAPWLILAVGWSAFRGKAMPKMLSNRWVATIGGMCYSIYLLHYPLFIMMSGLLAPLARLSSPAALIASFFILAPMAVGVGAVFFLLVERPFMDPSWPSRFAVWFHRFARRRPVRHEGSLLVLPASDLIAEVTPGPGASDNDVLSL
jgi:peptidoglycan/LPS O-acetylase OafA/YrhL